MGSVCEMCRGGKVGVIVTGGEIWLGDGWVGVGHGYFVIRLGDVGREGCYRM